MPDFDGEIKIRATLTPGDIKKTARQLKTELSSLFNTKSGDQVSTQFKKVQADIVKTIDKIDSLENKLSTLESASAVPTKEYEEIQKFIQETEQELAKIQPQLEEWKSIGAENTGIYQRLNAQAEELRQTIEYSKGDLQELVDTGKAFTLGTDTQEYQQTIAQLNEVNNQLVIQKARLGDVTRKESDFSYAAQKSRQIEAEKARQARIAAEATKKLKNETDKATKATKEFNKEHKKTSFSMDNFGGAIKRGLKMLLRYGLGIRSLFVLFRKLRTAVKEGLENLAEFSDPLKQSMDGMKASFTALKNNVAAAIAPLVQRFLPVITQAADAISNILTKIGMYIAALSGQTTYTRAIAVQEDYAESLENTADAAKEAQGQLAGFDELTIIGSEATANALGTSDKDSKKPMFEEVEIPSNLIPNLSKLSGLFDDLKKKFDNIRSIGEKFVAFIRTLDFGPLTESLGRFWWVLSPIIDELIADADWFREKVLQPIISFLVERGIPAAIDTISVALDNIWKVFQPIKDGLKLFWDQNGEWIMELVEEHTLMALSKIREAFSKIGDFFTKNKTTITKIFSSLSNIFKTLSPLIKTIAKTLGTHAWNTFVDSIESILDAIEPILDTLAAVLEILDGILTWDRKKVEAGFSHVGEIIMEALFAPLKIVLNAFATLIDGIAVVVEKFDKDAADAMRGFANQVRGVVEDVDNLTEASNEAANAGLTAADELQMAWELNEKFATSNTQKIAQMVSQIQRVGPTSKEEFETVQWWSNYCKKYGLDPLTGAFKGQITQLQATKDQAKYTYDYYTGVVNQAQYATQRAGASIIATSSSVNKAFSADTKSALQSIANAANGIKNQTNTSMNSAKTIVSNAAVTIGKSLNGLNLKQMRAELSSIGVTIDQINGYTRGVALGANFRDGFKAQSASIIQAAREVGAAMGTELSEYTKANINQRFAGFHVNVPLVIDSGRRDLMFDFDSMKAARYAKGGFPTPASLFWAGEGGTPEMLGTVGGQTAVAGGAEITGIRDEIARQGIAEQQLLSQLINAVNSKDLTLTANSATGRWVSKSLRAYQGVTG